jgi:biopolymer transport protein ExbD
MGIRFDCISCRDSIVVHDRLKGKQIRCPYCETSLVVPDNVLSDRSNSAQLLAEPLPSKKRNEEELLEAEVAEIPEAIDEDQQPPLDHIPAGKHSRHEREKHEEEDVEWDITPMVDVAFLLLIFFMLTAAFSIQKAIPTNPPLDERPSTATVQRDRMDPSERLTIQIDEYNGYTVINTDGESEQASSRQELYRILSDFKNDLGDQPVKVLVQAHNQSTHGTVVSCLDASRQAGFDQLQLQAVDEFE